MAYIYSDKELLDTESQNYITHSVRDSTRCLPLLTEGIEKARVFALFGQSCFQKEGRLKRLSQSYLVSPSKLVRLVSNFVLLEK